MAKKKMGLGCISPQQMNVSQVYPDVLMKAYTRKNHLRVGVGRTGVLTMVEANERFEFVEQPQELWTRNPLVYQGEYINIHRDKQGHYRVHLKQMELNNRFNVFRVAKAILSELLTSKKVLGL